MNSHPSSIAGPSTVPQKTVSYLTGSPLTAITVIVVLSAAAGACSASVESSGTNLNWRSKALESLTATAECAAALGTLWALLQLYWLRTTLRADADSSLYERLEVINQLFISNDGLWNALQTPLADNEAVDWNVKNPHICLMLFNAFEQVYHQYEMYTVIDDAEWESWKLSILHYFNLRYVRTFWDRQASAMYFKPYRDCINAILLAEESRCKATSSPQGGQS